MDFNQEVNWNNLVPELRAGERGGLDPIQVQALEEIKSAMKADKRIILFEGPTGTGKSAVLMALCRWFAQEGLTSFLTTPQRALQDQLGKWVAHDGLGEWSGVKVMKGKRSYACLIESSSAAFAPCTTEPDVRDDNDECKDEVCPYFKALKEAKNSLITVHN